MTGINPFKNPKIVLVFSGDRILRAVYHSLNYASRMCHIPPQSISHCCLGAHISCGGYYFRYVHPEVEMDFTDIGHLRLEEYDDLCGVFRQYHSPKEMARRRSIAEIHLKNTNCYEDEKP